MAETPSAEERERIRQYHPECGDADCPGGHHCDNDGWSYPCPMVKLLDALEAAERERDEARAEVKRLREYAWHKHSCYTDFPRPEGIPCTCGYEAALEGGPGA